MKREINSKDVVTEDPHDFIKHLEWVSSVVKTWPAWKQELLGGTAYNGEDNEGSELDSD